MVNSASMMMRGQILEANSCKQFSQSYRLIGVQASALSSGESAETATILPGLFDERRDPSSVIASSRNA